MTLPTDYTNSTPSTDQHPAAHNDTNAKVNALDTAVAANTAAVGTLDGRLDVLEPTVNALTTGSAVFGPPGHWGWSFPAANQSAVALFANQLRMTRIVIGRPFDALAVYVSGAVAASTAQLGLYNVNSVGMPTTLAWSGTVATATAGEKQATFTALPAGAYWFAFNPLAAISVHCASLNNPLVPMPAASTVNASVNCWFLNGQLSIVNPFVGPPSGVTNGMALAQVRFA